MKSEKALPAPDAEVAEDVRARIGASAASKRLCRLRRRSGYSAARALRATAARLQAFGHFIGPGRVDGTSPRGNGDDEVVGLALLLQIAGELVEAAVDLFSDGQAYAAAALVRQVVEVEYLAWAFSNSPGEANAWFNSTREQRHQMFQPRHLRRRSNGRFNAEDYAHHCEMGGHPVPRASALIQGASDEMVELLLMDLLLHIWRTMDAAVAWASKEAHLQALVVTGLDPSRMLLTRWSQEDPMYDLPPSPPWTD
jgi:hypothetical protein